LSTLVVLLEGASNDSDRESFGKGFRLLDAQVQNEAVGSAKGRLALVCVFNIGEWVVPEQVKFWTLGYNAGLPYGVGGGV